MTRAEITTMLGKLLERKIGGMGNYWASEVTFNWGRKDECRVDYMKFEPVNNSPSGLEKGIFICYEIKSSLADYRSPNGHNFLGEMVCKKCGKEFSATAHAEVTFSVWEDSE